METLRNVFVAFCIIGGLVILNSCSSNEVTDKDRTTYIYGCVTGQLVTFEAMSGMKPDYKFIQFSSELCTELAGQLKPIEASYGKDYI